MVDQFINRLRAFKYTYLNGVQHRTSFSKGRWKVRTWDGETIETVNNSYLAFHEIYGYLRCGKWSLAPGDVIVDAGACFGEFSLYASRRVGPTGRVILLEPDQANLKVFFQSCALQGGMPKNITVIEAALWNKREQLPFASSLGGGSTIVGTGKAGSTVEDKQVVLVEALPLQQLLADYGLDRIDFLKMDIEGAEVEVIEDAAHLTSQMGTKLAVASYHRRQNDLTCTLIEPILANAGMKCETGFATHRTTWAWK